VTKIPSKVELASQVKPSNSVVEVLQHSTKRHALKPFKCSEHSCAEKYCLTSHQRVHSEDKPFKCSECSYAARQKINLATQQGIHSNEKPFKS
jgi:KRAB domain-containing zinc finger protein